MPIILCEGYEGLKNRIPLYVDVKPGLKMSPQGVPVWSTLKFTVHDFSVSPECVEWSVVGIEGKGEREGERERGREGEGEREREALINIRAGRHALRVIPPDGFRFFFLSQINITLQWSAGTGVGDSPVPPQNAVTRSTCLYSAKFDCGEVTWSMSLSWQLSEVKIRSCMLSSSDTDDKLVL